jgi:hypothetical protein
MGEKPNPDSQQGKPQPVARTLGPWPVGPYTQARKSLSIASP